MPLILGTNSIKDTGFNVANSLRFNDDSSDSLERTQGTATSRRKFTLSTWLKRGNLTGSFQFFASSYNSSNDRIGFYFNSDDTLAVFARNSSGTTLSRQTTAKFRDTSAWYHVVYRIDTTHGNASDRARMYVNGVQITSFQSTGDPSQNYDLELGTSSYTFYVGTYDNSQYFFDGYMAETVFLDGADHDASFFGEFDSDSPTIWKPKDVSSLTFGNNGFYLNVPGPSTGQNANGLGGDSSGNGNHFASSNLSAVDQSTDTCTNNFATMNPLDNYYASSTFSEGNTKIVTDASAKASNTSTFGISSGKWYCEIKAVQIYNGYAQFGIKGKAPTSTTDGVGDGTDGYAYTASGGNKVNNGSATSYGTVWNNNDIIGIAVDLDNNKLYFSRNGTFQDSGDPTSGSTGTGAAFSLGTPSSGAYYIATSDGDTSGGSANTYEFNFGNPPYSISSGNSDANGHGNFDNAVPSGYFALCTKNLAEFG